MNDIGGLPGNVVFANVVAWIFTLLVLAAVWFGCVALLGSWIGGLLGWMPAVIAAVGARFAFFFCLQSARASFKTRQGKIIKTLD